MTGRTEDVMAMQRDTFATKRAELQGALDRLRATPEWQIAPPRQRTAAERTISAQLASLTAEYLGEARRQVQRTEAMWRAALPTVVQRKAAIGHPSRATAVAELVQLASPPERKRIADLLVAEADSAGAYGARQVLGAMDAPETNAGTIETLLQAGTVASADALRELLGAKRAYGRAEAAAHLGEDGNPLAVLQAANAAATIPLEDGERTFTSSEMAAILDGPNA